MNVLITVRPFTQWMEENRYTEHPTNCKALILADGTEVSIQASHYHYSIPRESLLYRDYSHFEIGFPSRLIPEIMEWVEDGYRPTDTVYGYVPKKVIEDFITKAGGVVGVLTVGQII